MAEVPHQAPPHQAPLWGVSAEFDTPEAILAAVRVLGPRGLGRLDAFSPVPAPGMAEALRLRRNPASRVAVLGAVLGGAVMFTMCAYASLVAYRFDVGGRPQFAWPAFVVPSVSFAMMAGTVAAFGAMLVLCRLPRLNHPAFNIPNFTRATQDRYFLAVEATGDGFDPAPVEAALGALAAAPRRIARVPR